MRFGLAGLRRNSPIVFHAMVKNGKVRSTSCVGDRARLGRAARRPAGSLSASTGERARERCRFGPAGTPRCGDSAPFRRAHGRPAERGPGHRSAMTLPLGEIAFGRCAVGRRCCAAQIMGRAATRPYRIWMSRRSTLNLLRSHHGEVSIKTESCKFCLVSFSKGLLEANRRSPLVLA